jgi:uncharacterized protein
MKNKGEYRVNASAINDQPNSTSSKPLKQGWFYEQTLEDVLFAHWKIPKQSLRDTLPVEIKPDLFEDYAYISIAAFNSKKLHFRGSFLGINGGSHLDVLVYTYVNIDQKPGFFFLSLDLSDPFLRFVIRNIYRIRCFNSIYLMSEQDHYFHYMSKRAQENYPNSEFLAKFTPVGDPFTTQIGSLDRWLVERNYYYFMRTKKRVFRGDFQSSLGALQYAKTEIPVNSLMITTDVDVDLPLNINVSHYAREVKTCIWRPRKIR